MILLQAYLYTHTYTLLRGVTFRVLPLSSYALSPTMLPLVETFLELLLWKSFQCHCHISLDVFNILKSSSLQGGPYFWKQLEVIWRRIRGVGWVLQFSNQLLGQQLLGRECFVSWNIVMMEIQSIGQSSGLFLHTASCNHSNIST
jgi:hypothetical protein